MPFTRDKQVFLITLIDLSLKYSKTLRFDIERQQWWIDDKPLSTDEIGELLRDADDMEKFRDAVQRGELTPPQLVVQEIRKRARRRIKSTKKVARKTAAARKRIR